MVLVMVSRCVINFISFHKRHIISPNHFGPKSVEGTAARNFHQGGRAGTIALDSSQRLADLFWIDGYAKFFLHSNTGGSRMGAEP